MKHLCCWSVLLSLCLALLAAREAPGGDAKGTNDDAKKVVGTWKSVTAEMAGKPFPEEFTKSTTLVLTPDKYKVTIGDKTDEGTWKNDPTKKPRTLEIKGTKGPNEGKTFLAIYELKGDTLRICYDLTGKAYPKEFKTAPKTALFLVEYKRQKP
jgi:uncharacterized protein (TIGR03067 family)